MASVYKALAAAAVSRGAVELPDGKTYTVRALSVADLLTLDRMQEERTPDREALPVLIEIAARVTGSLVAVIGLLEPEQVGYVIGMARHGVELVSAALAAEAPAEGNVPPTSSKGRRSTSRSVR